jgi:DNA-binding CsgD family transcriptional regulator
MDIDPPLLQLIGEIYDAAIDPDSWKDVLPKIGFFVGGSAGGLFAHHASRQSGNIFYEYGTSPGFRQLYLEKYMTMDPMFGTYFVLDVGEVFSTSTIMPHDAFLQSRFYKECIGPQGWIDNICVYLDKSSESHAGFALFRDKGAGLADEPARDRLRLLVPHLRRAVLIGNIIEFKTMEAVTFASAIDGLSAGLLFLDSSFRITHANAAANAMLAGGDVLRATLGRLTVCDNEGNRQLREIVEAAENGDAAVGTKGVAAPLAGRDGERYIAHVLPLSSGTRRGAGATYMATAAVFINKAVFTAQPPPEAIARTFRLTPMELRVLLAIVEIGGTPQVAETLGIGEGTVKAHLKRVYEKTGSHRQADLVKLFAAYTSPLAG